ncbi:MAG TPA: MBL fold metallo-hydrolase [Geminicoccus sp.]|jgi:glyoxylase-like metal-dependent hydrolase (beta-lactamase superfamily II)|uniref:MBL fold metallo-hydrolase n=1 Tax=Geminicoccus sp. TaxID=2024832 RepID=UPI002E36000D|nr:MBL fold metallo-hydrolase [Geminicoccus sp.]HEX2525830.1 MBL fold metallo-hydrolase [Geminicoccus sp.]
MAEQIPLSDEASAVDAELDAARNDHTHEIAPDLSYRRLGIVNVVFYGQPSAGDRQWVLIDAGLTGTKDLIKSAAAERFGENARPAAIVMTHGHFDHVGALVDLAEEWDAPVYAHRLELPYLNGSASYPPGDPSVGGGAMAALARFYPRSPVDVGPRLDVLPADGNVPFMPGWRWLHTPGHSVGHVSLWREADRTMVAGDAFVTTRQESAYAVAVQKAEMHGPPMYYTVEWDKAAASVRLLAGLEPDLVVTGHGEAMHGPEMRSALHRLAAEFETIAQPRQGRYLREPARAEDGTAYGAP